MANGLARGVLMVAIRVCVPYRIHPSIHQLFQVRARAGGVNTNLGPNSHAYWVPHWLRALHSSARYAATASVRGLLVAGIQVFVPYRIHPSIHRSIRERGGVHR